MTKFFYKAKDWNGKTIKGFLDSEDEKNALESIKAGGLIPLRIVVQNDSVLNDIYKKLFSKISLKEISNFTRQLSTMMTAGLALTWAALAIAHWILSASPIKGIIKAVPS